jgi:hypothetical protein
MAFIDDQALQTIWRSALLAGIFFQQVFSSVPGRVL